MVSGKLAAVKLTAWDIRGWENSLPENSPHGKFAARREDFLT